MSEVVGPALMFTHYLGHPLHDTVRLGRDGFRQAVKLGEVNHAGTLAWIGIVADVFSGGDLEKIET